MMRTARATVWVAVLLVVCGCGTALPLTEELASAGGATVGQSVPANIAPILPDQTPSFRACVDLDGVPMDDGTIELLLAAFESAFDLGATRREAILISPEICSDGFDEALESSGVSQYLDEPFFHSDCFDVILPSDLSTLAILIPLIRDNGASETEAILVGIESCVSTDFQRLAKCRNCVTTLTASLFARDPEVAEIRVDFMSQCIACNVEIINYVYGP